MSEEKSPVASWVHECEYVRGYVHQAEAWYSESLERPNEVLITVDHRDGEFAIRWYDLNSARPFPKLEVFNDSWKMLVEDFPDLLQALRENNNKDLSPKEMCRLLDSLGLEDQTIREVPEGYERRAPCCSECGRELETHHVGAKQG